jgi:hypothetical protein
MPALISLRDAGSGSAAFQIRHVHVRRVLYMPLIAAMRWNPVLDAFADRLQNKGKSPETDYLAVMRPGFVLAYGVLKSGKPFDREC